MITYEKFYDKIKVLRSPTSEVNYISIPKKLMIGLGLQKGQIVKIILQKEQEEEKENVE